MTTMVRLHREENVAILYLENGKTNTITPVLLKELSSVLRRAQEDPAIEAIVLSSRPNSFFSIGFDLPTIFAMERDEFTRFFAEFNEFCLRLFTVPKPTMSAILGHAVAGGCILATCTDYRFIAAGKTLMGMNEIKLGIPIPYVSDRILAFQIGDRNARIVADSGEFFSPFQLFSLKMVDQVLPADMVLREAVGFVRRIAQTSLPAFAMIKKNRVAPVVSQILQHRQERDRQFIDRWFAEDVRKRLKAALTRFNKT